MSSCQCLVREADSDPRLQRETHTNTQLQKKLTRGRLQLARGREEGRQGSFISFHRDYAFQVFEGTS